MHGEQNNGHQTTMATAAETATESTAMDPITTMERNSAVSVTTVARRATRQHNAGRKNPTSISVRTIGKARRTSKKSVK